MITDPLLRKENMEQFKDSVHCDAKRAMSHIPELINALASAEKEPDTYKACEYIMKAGEIAEKIAQDIRESLVRWK